MQEVQLKSLEYRMKERPWMVSMHGGHSGDFCDHADGSLRNILDAAITAGYHTFGISEHAPRCEDRFLYPNERKLGWSVEKTIMDFERYIEILPGLVDEYAGRLNIVSGFECEVVPENSYIERTLAYGSRVAPNESKARVFKYFVGSVHFVGEIPIDDLPERWIEAAEAHGGPESLAVAYYETIERMVVALHPHVIGHLDLIKLNVEKAGFDAAALLTPRVMAAAERALEAIREYNGILDLNTAGWRKGLSEPYPARWVVKRALQMNIPFCFGDDSHRPVQVGYGIDRAREYLLKNGVYSITSVAIDGDRIVLPMNA
jgi:histidinol-phosphatase (PHP family)